MQDFNKKDKHYLQRCLDLAVKGRGYVKLNPLVGCVIVHEDKIIGEGYHEKYGGPHAEVNAVNSVPPEHTDLLTNSTLYVSLEPCNITGKTPPCTNLIEKLKIPRVVIGMLDPNPKVYNQGVAYLNSIGVSTKVGLLEAEGKSLNKVFIKNQREQIPYITLKWAQSTDGYIGKKNERIQISNELSKRFSHQLRKDHDAILVGYNTALTDDPMLTDRFFHNHPIRVILDDELSLPNELNVFQQEDAAFTLVVNGKKEDLSGSQIKYLKIEKDNFFLDNLLKRLYTLEIGSLLIEGGRNTLQMFINSKLWDEAYIYESEQTINGNIKAPRIEGIRKESNLGDNRLLQIKLLKP